ncbi:MAG: T9SS type A sorting domain-containing protein [Sphingobacteriales bacterium]|nr:T9SS type A sorting domain-containing protein [Sphingobacteriales bacterium]
MKKIFTLLTIIVATVGFANAQPWTYDFGSTAGLSSSGVVLHTDGGAYLPAPQTNGGTARTRIGTAGGSFNIENPGTSLGSNGEFRAVAPTSTSVNKFSVFDYTGGKEVAIKFYVRFDGGASGTWRFMMGDGASFSDNNQLSSGQLFCGLSFVFGASDAITGQYRTAATWTALPSNPFSQKNNFKVEIYGNNGTSTVNYTYGTAQSIAANRYDVWVDGTLIGDDLTKGAIGNDVNIDSWMFYGESSVSNVANIYLDDISYSNSIASAPLPISLVKFTADKISEKVKLNWVTATEINNDKFIIERSADGENFELVSEVKGAGNSREINSYNVVDATPLKGTSYYRLTQVDFNGASETFAPVAVNMSGKLHLATVQSNTEAGNIDLNIYSPSATSTAIRITDLSGRTIASQQVNLVEGYQSVNINTNNLSSGIHIIQIMNGEEVVMKKLVL